MNRVIRRVLRASLLVGLLCTVFGAGAQETAAAPNDGWAEGYKEMRPYISGLYTYTFENSDRIGTDSGEGVQLSFGSAINEHWGWEIDGLYANYPHDDAPDGRAQREYGAKIDALYFYNRNYWFSPYFSAGAGALTTKLRGTGEDSTDPMVDAGLGFFKFFRIWDADFAFRADLRYRHTFFDKGELAGRIDDELNETVLKVGLVIPLGGRPGPGGPAAPTDCVDSDGDGVCDSDDLCPGTPKGTVVDAKGCPKEAAEGANKKLEDVYFAFDKSDLAETETAKLDTHAKVIDGLVKKYPKLKVDVAGHTDWVGTDGYNQGLSERRANTVKSYLIRKGVTAGRISTFAFGESKPAATNETAAGRALNRRAEVQTHE